MTKVSLVVLVVATSFASSSAIAIGKSGLTQASQK